MYKVMFKLKLSQHTKTLKKYPVMSADILRYRYG